VNAAVFYNAHDVAEVGRDWYEKLKRHACDADNKRARLCLHHSPEDPLHEMIVVFHRDAIIRPHRHRGKTESYHAIFGELDILMFDENGQPTRVVCMGDFASGGTHVCHMSRAIWHTVLVRSEYAAIHEVTNGPFRPEEREFAPWSPENPDELRAFLKRSVESLSHR
jgi:cupin fold WbuC family metalloprotein